MGLADAFAPAEASYKEAVMQNTWGHLAPTRNKKYTLRLVFAAGCLGSDDLNPTCLVFESEELDSSPWFYNALQDFMHDNRGPAGHVYEFTGYFRNYTFRGNIRLLLDTNKQGASDGREDKEAGQGPPSSVCYPGPKNKTLR